MKHLHELHLKHKEIFTKGFYFVKGKTTVDSGGFNVVRIYAKKATINGNIVVAPLRFAAEHHGKKNVYVFEPEQDVRQAKGEMLFSDYELYKQSKIQDALMWYLAQCGFRAIKSKGVNFTTPLIKVFHEK